MPDSTRQADDTDPRDLEAEAKVTASDRELSPRFWGRYGTPVLRALLRAVTRKRDG